MRRGIVRFDLTDAGAVVAPTSGIQLGTGNSGPVSLRLFRVSGTRVTLAGTVLPAQLIVIRAAAAGTPVQVVTSRPHLWQSLLRTDSGAHVVSPTEVRQPVGGPTLLVDDRPAEVLGQSDVNPWQCRIEVRTQWMPTELPAFSHNDLVVFGAVAPEFAAAVSRAFGVPPQAAEPLSRLDPRSFAIMRRGRVEYLTLNPTSAEAQLLDRTRGAAEQVAPRPAPSPTQPPAQPPAAAPRRRAQHARSSSDSDGWSETRVNSRQS